MSGETTIPALEPFSIDFKVVVFCLQGESGIEGRRKSLLAWDAFRKNLPPHYGFMHYIDRYGYPVMCLTIMVTDEYPPEAYISLWNSACTQFDVKAANSYEQILDYRSIIFGSYSLEKDGRG